MVSGCPTANTPPHAEVLESGLCTQSEMKRYPLPQSTAGYASTGNVVIVKETEIVPLRKGIGFGFSWRATGLPQRAEVKYVYEHPPITRPDGKGLEGFEEPLTHFAINGVVTTTDCYFLSGDHELMSGTWSISVVFNGATLAKRSYQVVRQ